MHFENYGLSSPLLNNLLAIGFNTPTPIQSRVIPCFFRNQDILASAQTGTGKTGAFLIPIIDSLMQLRRRSRMPRAIILEPTRELAIQVFEQFQKLSPETGLTAITLVGGESMVMQERALARGIDIVIATPGRLLDLCEKGKLILLDIKTLVLDEADRMLDMGFIPDVEKLVSLIPMNRQTVLLSATFDAPIEKLAQSFLINPVRISVDPGTKTAVTITQYLTPVEKETDKRAILREILRKYPEEQIIVFCNRKRDANTLLKSCQKHGFKVGALHGDMTQMERNQTLDGFKAQEILILIASDVAARGIDVNDLSVVVNFDVPINAEDYVHRIGRTGRAGKTGFAYTLALPKEKRQLSAIEKLIDQTFVVFTIDVPEELKPQKAVKTSRSTGRNGDEPRTNEPRTTEPRSSTRRVYTKNAEILEQHEPTDGPIIGFGSLTPEFMKREVVFTA